MRNEWQLVWNDEFDSERIDESKWNFVTGGGGYGNRELQFYTSRPENARVEGGCLILSALNEKYGNKNYTSAKLTTEGKGEWQYGRFEMRAKLPSGKGMWPAFWMMPSSFNYHKKTNQLHLQRYGKWPACGEIDIMELIGHEPDKVHGTIHYGMPRGRSGAFYQLPEGGSFNDDFHIFSLEWDHGEFRWFVDGNQFQNVNEWFSRFKRKARPYPAPFDQPFFIQLNFAVGGNWPKKPDRSVMPQEFVIDYVRVYQKK